MKSRSSLILGALFCASFASGAAGQADPDPRPLFTWRDAVLGGAFVGATIAIRPLDKSAALALQQPTRQQNRLLQRGAGVVRYIAQPGSTYIGLTMYAAGRLTGNDRLAQVGLHGTEALIVGSGVGTAMKYFFGRARPFVDTTGPNPDDWKIGRGWSQGGSYQAFPSGHTTAAFAAAAAVTSELSAWWPDATYFLIGPLLYGGAASAGLSRMYQNRHWASDVIMGAAIGTFAGTKVVRYHRTHSGNRIDRLLLRGSWSPADGTLSFSLLPDLRR